MKTVDKAFQLLDQFTLEHREVGLSDLARRAGLDKAATRRMLVALARHGFIEQSADTKKYRLGHGFLRLARVREATVPMARAAQEVSDWLCEEVGETVHVSVPGAQGMMTIAHRLPNRGQVINIVPAQVLPFHATASGLAFLAFSSDEALETALKIPREALSARTLLHEEEIRSALSAFRQQGYSQTQDSFETGVSSIAKPFFTGNSAPGGTVSIAMQSANLNEARRRALVPALDLAVAKIERSLAGL